MIPIRAEQLLNRWARRTAPCFGDTSFMHTPVFILRYTDKFLIIKDYYDTYFVLDLRWMDDNWDHALDPRDMTIVDEAEMIMRRGFVK